MIHVQYINEKIKYYFKQESGFPKERRQKVLMSHSNSQIILKATMREFLKKDSLEMLFTGLLPLLPFSCTLKWLFIWPLRPSPYILRTVHLLMVLLWFHRYRKHTSNKVMLRLRLWVVCINSVF